MTLLTPETRLTRRYYFAIDLSIAFLNIGATDEIFQKSGEQDSFRYMSKV